MSYKYFYSLNYKKINKNKKKIKAVFLDRDGTLNIDTGYINDIKDIRMMPGTYKALRSFADMGFHLVIITNQSGIARGLIDQDQLKKVNSEMLLKFKRKNIEFLGIYFCPHFKEGVVEAFSFECRCRKPNAFMIKRA